MTLEPIRGESRGVNDSHHPSYLFDESYIVLGNAGVLMKVIA